jgi:hypothetical protein
LIDGITAVTLCSTAVWATNAATAAGSRSGTSGSSATQLDAPSTVFVDNTSAIYVADSYNFRVQRFPPNSTTGTTVVNGSFGTNLNQFSSSKYMVH